MLAATYTLEAVCPQVPQVLLCCHRGLMDGENGAVVVVLLVEATSCDVVVYSRWKGCPASAIAPLAAVAPQQQQRRRQASRMQTRAYNTIPAQDHDLPRSIQSRMSEIRHRTHKARRYVAKAHIYVCSPLLSLPVTSLGYRGNRKLAWPPNPPREGGYLSRFHPRSPPSQIHSTHKQPGHGTIASASGERTTSGERYT